MCSDIDVHRHNIGTLVEQFQHDASMERPIATGFVFVSLLFAKDRTGREKTSARLHEVLHMR
jgi:hypothetical protein